MRPDGARAKDDLDRYGREIPDEEYRTKDFERVVALRARTQAIARHLTDFMKKTDRFAKTIVFCVDQEHAAEMRQALNNLNADLDQQYPDYVCRVTSMKAISGAGILGRFRSWKPPRRSSLRRRNYSPPAWMRRRARTSCSRGSSIR